MYPVLDAGDLTYSFYLLSSVSRAGVQLTILAMRRTDDRVGSASDNGIEWVLVPWECDREIGGRLAVWSCSAAFRMLRPNIMSHRSVARSGSKWRAIGMRSSSIISEWGGFGLWLRLIGT
jgi:hypothetical protein